MAKKKGFFSKVFGADSAIGRGAGNLYEQLAGGPVQPSKRSSDRLRAAQARKVARSGYQPNKTTMTPTASRRSQGQPTRQGQAAQSRTGSGRLHIPGTSGNTSLKRNVEMERRLRELEDDE